MRDGHIGCSAPRSRGPGAGHTRDRPSLSHPGRLDRHPFDHDVVHWTVPPGRGARNRIDHGAGLVISYWAREMPGFWWSLISAALGVLAGAILLARPMQGGLTLTIVVGVYFLAEGVATIMYALEHRRELSERWSWLLVAGIVDIVIAGLIITGLPGSALWAVGLLVGINLLFGGASLIGMALAARPS